MEINLKDIYPSLYHNDMYIEVDSILAEMLEILRKEEHALAERIRVHNTSYSEILLTCQKGKQFVESPETIFFTKVQNEKIIQALSILNDNQRKRVIAYFFMDMKMTDIAKKEGRDKSVISRSITKALKSMREFLEKLS